MSKINFTSAYKFFNSWSEINSKYLNNTSDKKLPYTSLFLLKDILDKKIKVKFFLDILISNTLNFSSKKFKYTKFLIINFIQYILKNKKTILSTQITRLELYLKKLVNLNKLVLRKKRNKILFLNTKIEYVNKKKRIHEYLYIHNKFFLFILKNRSIVKSLRLKKLMDIFLFITIKQIKDRIAMKSSLNISKKMYFFYGKKTKHDKITTTSLLYNRILGLLLKKGEKHLSLKIFKDALLQASKLLLLSVNTILLKLYLGLKVAIELKKIRTRRNFTYVPFPISLNRKIYLVAKWLLLCSLKKSGYFFNKTSEKLCFEIVQVIKKKNNLALKTRNANISNCLIYRSNKHFRW